MAQTFGFQKVMGNFELANILRGHAQNKIKYVQVTNIKKCKKPASTPIWLCYTLITMQPGAQAAPNQCLNDMDTFLVLGVSSFWKNPFSISLRKMLLFGACCSLPPKRLLHWSQQWQFCCGESISAWELPATPLVGTEDNSLGYVKQHKQQLLL